MKGAALLGGWVSGAQDPILTSPPHLFLESAQRAPPGGPPVSLPLQSHTHPVSLCPLRSPVGLSRSFMARPPEGRRGVRALGQAAAPGSAVGSGGTFPSSRCCRDWGSVPGAPP